MEYPTVAEILSGPVHAVEKDLDLSSPRTAYDWALENIPDLNDEDTPEYQEVHENRAREYSSKFLDVMGEPFITIYRAVCLNDISELDLKKIGTHWSFEPEGVGCYGSGRGQKGNKTFVLTGIVNPKDIDWEYGFTSFMWYGEDQWECALNHSAPVKIIKIDQKNLEKPLKGQATVMEGGLVSQRTFAKATIPEDSELMEFYYLADREGWAEQVSEEASEEWDRMSLEERKEVIPELISEGFSQHFPHKPKTEEDWKEVKGYFLSLRERQEADNTDSTQIFFEDAKIITNPTLVRFTDHPEGVMEHGFNGYGPRNLGLTMHYRPGIGDLAFAFDIKDLKTQKDWEHAEGSYGQYIFKFKVPYAVKAYHISDGEKQVVFDVTTVKDLKKIEMPLAKGRKKPGMKKDEEIPFLKYPTVEMVLALGTDSDHFEFYFDRMSPSFPIKEIRMGDENIAIPPGATTSEIIEPWECDIEDAWQVLEAWFKPEDDTTAWIKEFKAKYLEAVKKGKLSRYPMDKAVKTFKVANYGRKVPEESLDNPIIVATYPGARYLEVLDGSHRLIQRYKAGLKDVPVLLVNLPWWKDDFDAVDADTIEDLLPLK